MPPSLAWVAWHLQASIRLDRADIYRHRVGSSDDPAPMVPYDPTLSSGCRGTHQNSFALAPAGNSHLKPGHWGGGNNCHTPWRSGGRQQAPPPAEGKGETGPGREQDSGASGCGRSVGRGGGGMAGPAFLRGDRRAVSPTSECGGGGWSQASISLFSLFFFFHDRKEEKLLFFSCSCTCKAAGGGGGEETEGLEDDDMGKERRGKRPECQKTVARQVVLLFLRRGLQVGSSTGYAWHRGPPANSPVSLTSCIWLDCLRRVGADETLMGQARGERTARQWPRDANEIDNGARDGLLSM